MTNNTPSIITETARASARALPDADLHRMLSTVPDHSVGSPLHLALIEESDRRAPFIQVYLASR